MIVDVQLPPMTHAPEILPEHDYDAWAFYALADRTINRMSDTDIIHALIAKRKLDCKSDGIAMKLIARLDHLRGGSRTVADELAPELRITHQAAQTHIGVAQALNTRLPRLLDAMTAGELNASKARQAVDATAPLPDDLARQVDAVVAQRIGEKNPPAWRACLTRAVHALDPHGARDRAAARRKDRAVTLTHEPDTMATLSAYLPAEVASAAYTRIDAMARKLKARTEQRSMDQLRADVMADLLLGNSGGADGVAAQVFVHVPINAALNITEQGCELVGHGPIPAAIARDLINNPDSVLRKVVTDPVTGNVLDVGRTRYRPTAAIRDLVRARDRHCRAPGCRRPAQHCDQDHTHDWANGGDTAACALCCYCRHHHQLKNEPGWHYNYNPTTGQLTVTTPTGQQHTTHPEPLIEPIPPF